MLSAQPPLDPRCAVPLPPHSTDKSAPDSLGGASSSISTVFHTQTHPPLPSPPPPHTTATPLHLTARLKLYCPRISSRSAGPGCFIHHPAAVLGGPSHTAQSSVGDSGVGAIYDGSNAQGTLPNRVWGTAGWGSYDTHSTLNNGGGEAHGTYCVKEVQGPGGSGGKIMVIVSARAVNSSLVTIPSLPFTPLGARTDRQWDASMRPHRPPPPVNLLRPQHRHQLHGRPQKLQQRTLAAAVLGSEEDARRRGSPTGSRQCRYAQTMSGPPLRLDRKRKEVRVPEKG